MKLINLIELLPEESSVCAELDSFFQDGEHIFDFLSSELAKFAHSGRYVDLIPISNESNNGLILLNTPEVLEWQAFVYKNGDYFLHIAPYFKAVLIDKT